MRVQFMTIQIIEALKMHWNISMDGYFVTDIDILCKLSLKLVENSK